MRIAIILVILGLVVGGVLYGVSQNKAKAQAEAMAFKAQVESAEVQYAEIAASLEGIEEFAPKARKVLGTASNLVPEIVGYEHAPRVYDREYDQKKKAEAWKKTVAAQTKKAVPAESDKAGGAIRTGVMVDEKGREMPAGLTGHGAPKPPPAPAVGTSGATGAGDATQHEIGGKLGERIKAGQDLYEKLCEHVGVIEARIDESALILTQSEKIVGRVKEAPTAFKAAAAQAGFAELVPMAKNLRNGMAEELAAAEAILPKFESMRDEVAEEKRAADAEAEQRRLAQQREENRSREVARAAGFYGGLPELLKSYQFTDAMQQVQDLQSSLTFEEAVTALDIPVERYRLLANAMTWLIAQFEKKPMSYGWKTARGALDIPKADGQGIYVQEKLIPWVEIPKERVIGFFSHYLEKNEDVGKSKADLYAGAAIYCKTFGFDDFTMDGFISKARNESKLTGDKMSALIDFQIDGDVAD